MVHEAAYKKNISLHRAIQKTPYYVVFGIEPNEDCHDTDTENEVPEEDSTIKDQSTGAEWVKPENEQQIDEASQPGCTME